MVNYLDQIQKMNHVQLQYLYETCIQIMAYSGSQNDSNSTMPSGGLQKDRLPRWRTIFKPDLSFYVCYFTFKIYNIALCTSTIFKQQVSDCRIFGELRSSKLERLDCDVEFLGLNLGNDQRVFRNLAKLKLFNHKIFTPVRSNSISRFGEPKMTFNTKEK